MQRDTAATVELVASMVFIMTAVTVFVIAALHYAQPKSVVLQQFDNVAVIAPGQKCPAGYPGVLVPGDEQEIICMRSDTILSFSHAP